MTPISLIGNSSVIQALRAEIAGAARTNAKVLISGETGAGKEVVARLIHAHSSRAARKFVPVNCSGIPESLLESELFGHTRGSFTGAYRDKIGLIRQAAQGTLFLDELGEMSLRMQAALLRFAETGEIQVVGADQRVECADVRLIAATHRDLGTQVRTGAFREDLWYRLKVIEIRVPPVRDRGEDILLLLEHYVAEAARMHRMPPPTFTPDAAQLLLAYEWPGNVRQLRNLAERLMVHTWSRAITPDDLPPEIVEPRRRLVAAPVGTARRAAVAAVPQEYDLDEREQSQELDFNERTQQLWDRLEAGEDFWTVVREPFRAHQINRRELAAIVDRGLRQAGGRYGELLKVFNLERTEYKRLHGFLYSQGCNLSVASYRNRSLPFRRRKVAS